MVVVCVCVTRDTDIRVIITTTITSITTTTITSTKFPNITKTTISKSHQNGLCEESDRFGGRLGCQILTLWTRVFEHLLILVSYRGFGTNYRCHLLKSSCPRTLKMGQICFHEKSLIIPNNAAWHPRRATISFTPQHKPVIMQNYEYTGGSFSEQPSKCDQHPSIRLRINVAWRMCTTHFIHSKTQKQM